MGLREPGPVILSLNEIDALAKKAARGSGYTWGQAEDAGKAVRWLCQNSLDGAGALAALLRALDGRNPADFAPTPGTGQLVSQGGWLCPLATGAYLSDRAKIEGTLPLRLASLAAPILILPFARTAAVQANRPVRVTGAAISAICSGRGTDCPDGADHGPADLAIDWSDDPVNPRPGTNRAIARAACLRTLHRFEHQTYAPATEASRKLGAGAGTSDND